MNFVKDFIDRFQETNDRGFANLQNFRAEFTQRLATAEDGRLRIDLAVEAYRHYSINNFSFNIDAGGAGVHVSYDPDPDRRVTLGVSAMPVYGEIRRLLFTGGSLGNDLLVRASVAGLVTLRPIDGVEVGVLVSFQPQWIDFGHYRSLQEVYAKLVLIPGRLGNDRYYLQDLVIVPRLIQWINTDPTIGQNPTFIGRVSPQLAELSQTAPALVAPPRNEMIVMGSLGFRFSL